MKQALQLFIITLLIVSCTKKQSNQIEQYDSMIFTDAEIRNQEIQDSLQQARLDSLALIAWGDAKFGMSMKETLSTNAFKNGRKRKHSKKCTFYTLRFGCSFAAVNTIKPQLL